MPGYYNFVFANAPVGLNQERLLTLELFNPDRKNDTCVVTFQPKAKTFQSESLVDTTPNIEVINDNVKMTMDCDINREAPEGTEAPASTNTAMAFERSDCEAWLPPWPDKNTQSSLNLPVLPYPQDEIDDTHGLERERLVFFNKKLNELLLSKTKTTYSKEEIYGIIDTSWTSKRVELTELRCAKLKTMEENLKMVHSEHYSRVTKRDEQYKSVNNNSDKLDFVKSLIVKHHGELASDHRSRRSQNEIEKDLDSDFSELKKTLSAYDKALDHKEKHLNMLSDEIQTSYVKSSCLCESASYPQLDPDVEERVASELLKEEEDTVI